MSIKDFWNNLINTWHKIYDAWKEAMDNEQISFLKFFWKALKDTSIWAYYVFLKWEIDGLLKKEEISRVKNETTEKVAYLLWGYFLNPATLINLKTELENQWISVKMLDKRYNSKSSLNSYLRELTTKLNSDEWKDIVLFGYSSGGILAHKIWKKHGHSVVSFWVPEDPKESLVWSLVSLTKDSQLEKTMFSENSTNIVETFSAMVPNTENEWDVKLKDVYSHMTIWREDVVEQLANEVMKWFNR
jgi:hypothetical protein